MCKFAVKYNRSNITGVRGAWLIERLVIVFGITVWRSYWIQINNNDVVKVGHLLDVSQANKLLQKL